MVEVTITGESRFPINRARIRDEVSRMILEQGVKGKIEVEILVVGDRKIRELNRKFRRLDAATDVLSFPLEDANAKESFVVSPDGILRLGSVVVSYPQALKQAEEENTLLDDAIAKLVEHGVLHLLGIHHE